jgi:hypothetical protein
LPLYYSGLKLKVNLFCRKHTNLFSCSTGGCGAAPHKRQVETLSNRALSPLIAICRIFRSETPYRWILRGWIGHDHPSPKGRYRTHIPFRQIPTVRCKEPF